MDCQRIHETSYNDWSIAFLDRNADKRIPISGSIELTFRCNNNCVHCYCNIPAGDKAEIAREMDTEMIASIFDQITNEGCLYLLITGGEPFLRPDFKDIYLYAKKKGLLITIFTNGTMITEEMADFLSEWKPLSMEITLYGITEEIYERVTMIPGSYRRCMDGIKRLIERDIPIELKTIAMSVNLNELWEMQRYAEGLGLKFRFDPVLNSRLDGGKSPSYYRLSADDVIMLDTTDEKRLKEWREFCDKYLGPPNSDKLYNCGAGLNSFHIDPYGNLNICMIARRPSYNLKNGTFKEGWNNFITGIRDLTPSRETPCRKCSLASLCGQCPGWSQIEHGDDETPVDYICNIAHKRAEALGVKV